MNNQKTDHERFMDGLAEGHARGNIKVHVTLDDPEAVVAGESLWATPLKTDDGRRLAVINNLPFHAPDLNYEDIVEVDAEGEVLRVVARAPHGLVRLVFTTASDHETERKPVLQQLIDLGCRLEHATERFWVATVPASQWGVVDAVLCAAIVVEAWEVGREPEGRTRRAWDEDRL